MCVILHAQHKVAFVRCECNIQLWFAVWLTNLTAPPQSLPSADTGKPPAAQRHRSDRNDDDNLHRLVTFAVVVVAVAFDFATSSLLLLLLLIAVLRTVATANGGLDLLRLSFFDRLRFAVFRLADGFRQRRVVVPCRRRSFSMPTTAAAVACSVWENCSPANATARAQPDR